MGDWIEEGFRSTNDTFIDKLLELLLAFLLYVANSLDDSWSCQVLIVQDKQLISWNVFKY